MKKSISPLNFLKLNKMKRNHLNRIIIFLLVSACSFNLGAQTSFKPQKLGEAINSNFAEINPILHPDGKTLFFTRVNHPENHFGGVDSQDIWYTVLNEDGTWSKAKRLPNTVNIGRYNAIFGILEDGKTFIINGHFSENGKQWLDRGLSVIERLDDSTWSKPVPLMVRGLRRMNRGLTTTAYMTPDGKYLLLSFSKKAGGKNHKIFLSEKTDNGYSKPQKLKIGVGKKCESYEAPFLSKDGNALYFGCKINKGYNIYMSNRTDENSFLNWSSPLPLNDTINTPAWENYYKLNAKESWAYYCSAEGEGGKSEIMRVKIYEEFPYVKFSGLIMNKFDESLMLADTNYTINVTGGEPSKLIIDKASASYELLLPFGKKYTVAPELQNWVGVTDTVDLTSVKEYTEINKNLFLEPISVVSISGKVINTRTGIPINPEMKFKVLVNGQENDSVKYEKEIAKYRMTLPLGEKYILKLQLPNFVAKADTVDVTSAKYFTEKQVDFYATSVPWVLVKGVALDNVTFTPITGTKNAKLLINGKVADSINIDPVTGEFKVRLPFGKKYKTSLSSSNYKPLENELDLTGYVEYTEVKHEVFAERKDANMAILSGKIINLKTGQPLDSNIPVKLKVNGTETRGFKYDSTKATYTLKLPVGATYDILPSVKNFYNKYEQVDLRRVRKGSRIARNFYVTPIEVGQTVNIDFIYFDTGKSTLKPQSFRSLNALVEFLNEYPNVIVEIGGHTDNTGSLALNMRLSKARAEAVAEYLISMGIPRERITSKGYGPSKPKTSNRTSRGRAQNRRVEFTIVGI